MTDAERLLHKTSGGLSLFDRLERDPELRAQLMDIVSEIEEMVEADDLEGDMPMAVPQP